MRNNGGSADTPIENRIDFSNICVFGHSFGGAAAFSACFSDKRIKAGINMDGTLYGVDNGIKNKAFMLMTSSSYAVSVKAGIRYYNQLTKAEQEDLASKGVSPEQYDSLVKTTEQSRKGFKDVTDNGGYFISLQDTEHYNFSDLPFISPLSRLAGLTGKIDASRGAEIVEAYTLSFFNKYLKEESSTLLNGFSEDYPEVIFENIN